MDSITQITLGAAVGELTLGKKVGNRAPLCGAIAGTIPDLDITMNAFLDVVDSVALHRGLSHSIVFAILFSPLLAFLISRIHRKLEPNYKDWLYLTFWCTITHPLLDCFTTYGTQLFYPFTTYPVAFNTISVIDPAYTAPFFLSIILVLFFKRTSSIRRKLLYFGLVISSLYLLFTVVNKLYVASIFSASLKRQGIQYSRIFTAPSFLNNILWRCVVEDENYYWEGYYSLFDRNKDIKFYFVEKNHDLLDTFRENTKIKKLLRFMNHLYSVENENSSLVINDMRYGRANGWVDSRGDFIFSFSFDRQKFTFERLRPAFKLDQNSWNQFFDRIFGKTSYLTF